MTLIIMKRITRKMAKEDSDSDEIELITQEQFIHSTRAIVEDERSSDLGPECSLSISKTNESSEGGHAVLPLCEESSSVYIPCEIEDLLLYEPVHSVSAVDAYFSKCRGILKKRKLGRWEKEFLMKLLHRKKQDIKSALQFVEIFKENFECVIQKSREQEGKELLERRLKKRK